MSAKNLPVPRQSTPRSSSFVFNHDAPHGRIDLEIQMPWTSLQKGPLAGALSALDCEVAGLAEVEFAG
jgi:hypothetical protein